MSIDHCRVKIFMTLYDPHFFWMTFIVEENEVFDVMNIGFSVFRLKCLSRATWRTWSGKRGG